MKMKLDFSNHLEAQDMIWIIEQEKGISATEAVGFSVNEKIYSSILNAGWASMALSLWGHDDPDRKWEILENPNVEIDFDDNQLYLIEKVKKKENVNIITAIIYFLLFTMDSMGYHI